MRFGVIEENNSIQEEKKQTRLRERERKKEREKFNLECLDLIERGVIVEVGK